MKRDDMPGAQPQSDAAAADTAWRRVFEAACAPYRGAGRWPYHWARGKLSRDPAFRALLERGDFRAAGRLVDIGCGQGLVAALLLASRQVAAAGGWPAAWPPAPTLRQYTGIELMAKDADRARDALSALPIAPRIVCGDMRDTPLPDCDTVVILDVLHYVDHAAQRQILDRVRAALDASRGRLLLRVGDAASARGFAVSQWVDRVVTAVRGHRASPTWGRTVAEWTALLAELGFAVQAVPMSHGTPFANVLLVADLR